MQQHDQLIVGIDVGSSKFCSTVAARGADGRLRYIGHGSTPSGGIRGGGVYDAEALTRAFGEALAEGARLAGLPATDVVLSVSGARLTTQERSGGCRLELATPVTGDDVMRALPPVESDGSFTGHPVHRVVRSIALDGHPLPDPTGRIGKRLEVTTRDYLAPVAWLDEVRGALERAGGRVHALVPTAVAAAAATLTEAERAGGVIVADVGAVSTDVAVYVNGGLRELAAIPYGAQHITLDLAQVLNIDDADAEDLKCRYGAADPFDAGVPGIEWGARGIATLQRQAAQGHVPAGAVRAIAGARLRLIFEELAAELAAAGVNPKLDAPAGIVLTGGGAKLAGVEDIAADTFGVPARRGGVRSAGGFPEIPDPSASASIGLARYCAGRIVDQRADAEGGVAPVARHGSARPAAARVKEALPAVFRYDASTRARSAGARRRWVLNWMREFIPARALD